VIPTISGAETTPGPLSAFDLDKLNAAIDFEIIGSELCF
jgi:hypothetical protein